MFSRIVEQLELLKECGPFIITQAEFDAWKYGYAFEAIKGQRYGQSFCQHFSIVDYILRFSTSMEEADTYIKRTYIK
jgi:hypothetical protein